MTMETMNVLQPSKCQNQAKDVLLLSSPEEMGFSSSQNNNKENARGGENAPSATAMRGLCRASMQQILEDSDDEDDSLLVSGMSLTLGQAIPSVSSASDLNYDITAKEGDKFEVFVTVADTPLVLHDIDASEWKKNDFLKDVFKKPSTRLSKKLRVEAAKDKLVTTPLVFPQCLLLGAKTLNDWLVIINWWLNQS